MVRFTRSPSKRIRHGQPDSPYEDIRVVNPSRGLNQLVADILTDNKDASDLGNVEFAEGGVVQKRPGVKYLGTGLSKVPGGMGVFRNGTESTLFAVDDGKLKKYENDQWSAISSGVGVSKTASIHMSTIAGNLYIWDGDTGGTVYNGSTHTRPGAMPRGKFSVSYRDFHIVAGVAGQGSRLYISSTKEPSRFTWKDPITATDKIDLSKPAEVPGATVFTGDQTPNAIDVNRFDGDVITGLGFFQDALIIFKENSIYQMNFNESNIPVVQRITEAYGCIAHGSIRTVENDVYFLSRDGVYVLGNEPNYYASIRTNELTSRIKPTIDSINQSEVERVRSIYWDNRYMLSVPTGSATSNNLLIVYDKRFYAWSLWYDINASDLAVYTDETNRRHLVFTDSKEPRMNQFTPGLYNDNGKPIEAWWTSRAFQGRKLDLEKLWKEVRPIFRKVTGTVDMEFFDENGSFGGTVSINASALGGLGYDQVGALMFGTSLVDTYTSRDLGLAEEEANISSANQSSNEVYSVRVARDARTLKIKFSNNKLDENFVLLGFSILFKNKDVDRFKAENTYRQLWYDNCKKHLKQKGAKQWTDF